MCQKEIEVYALWVFRRPICALYAKRLSLVILMIVFRIRLEGEWCGLIWKIVLQF